MDVISLIAGVVVVGLCAGVGVPAVTTGWVLPWHRGRVLRPRLWGYGCLLVGAAAVLSWCSENVSGDAAYGVLSDSGLACLLVGFAVQFLGHRAGRVSA
ncbi:hypothetical protein ACWGQ5_38100 [Streptomyces sp. NPDC055722]